jgi:hypothetical protein
MPACLDFPPSLRLTDNRLVGDTLELIEAIVPNKPEKPASRGIDPNAKQELHKECDWPWQGFSRPVARWPQRRRRDAIMLTKR